MVWRVGRVRIWLVGHHDYLLWVRYLDKNINIYSSEHDDTFTISLNLSYLYAARYFVKN